jgi:hypothetical protein
MAGIGGTRVRAADERAVEVIRIDAAWFAVEPMDMRAGVDTVLARVVNVFGEARAHHAYLLINKRANRMKVLAHDGFGLWLCARRLYEGSLLEDAHLPVKRSDIPRAREHLRNRIGTVTVEADEGRYGCGARGEPWLRPYCTPSGRPMQVAMVAGAGFEPATFGL